MAQVRITTMPIPTCVGMFWNKRQHCDLTHPHSRHFLLLLVFQYRCGTYMGHNCYWQGRYETVVEHIYPRFQSNSEEWISEECKSQCVDQAASPPAPAAMCTCSPSPIASPYQTPVAAAPAPMLSPSSCEATDCFNVDGPGDYCTSLLGIR